MGDGGDLDQGPEHNGGGHVVGQVGHQVPRPGAPLGHQRRQVEGQRVPLDDLDADGLDHRAQHGDQVAIGLHRHHRGPRLGQGQRQRPQARPDLEHTRVCGDAGETGDPPDRVGVSDEVLPEGPAGVQSVRRQQLGDGGTGMGHQEIVTSTTPWLRSAICEKPSGDRSTTRGYPAPSRSSTVQLVEAPVALFTTVSTVPKASVGLAHIPDAAAEYHVASPTSSLDATTGGGAVVVVVGGGAGVVVVVVGGSGAGGGGAVVDVVAGADDVVDTAAGAAATVVVVVGAW